MQHPLTGRWRPLLDPSQAPQARAALEAILQAVPGPDHPGCGASLVGGHAGLALLFAYAALAETGARHLAHRDRARAHVAAAAAQLPSYRAIPGLFAGYAGVAWTVDHLQGCGILIAGEDLNAGIDEALLAWLALEPGSGWPDLVSGLAGVGLYALDRPPGPRSRRLVARVLERLQATAESTGQGTAWFGRPEQLAPPMRRQHPAGAFDLGVAHGMAGVIGFLAEAWHCGFSAARPLLDSSMAWLLSCRSPRDDGSVFGRTFGRGEPVNPEGCRLSWCYGDLGMATVLLLAAVRTGQSSWRQAALEVARAAAERPDPWRGVVDAGLCHGAMGNAHLFARLYQATGEARFQTRALAGYERALALCRETVETAGLPAANGSGEASSPALSPDPGLLTGAAGLGLGLLAATTSVEPCWDRHLLIHLPPQARP